MISKSSPSLSAAVFRAALVVLALPLTVGTIGAAPACPVVPLPPCPTEGWEGGLISFLQTDAAIDTRDPGKVDCAFHQWSWETFVWATALDASGLPRFMSLPTPDQMVFQPPVSERSSKLTLTLGTRVHGQGGKGELRGEGAGAIVEADGNMLVAPNGYPVYASVHMNQAYFTTAVANTISTGNYLKNQGDYFPVGAAVFKATWLRLDENENAPAGAFTIQAEVPVLANIDNVVAPVISNGKIQTRTVTVALVGLHVVGQTHGHPEFLWATFEHDLNAPEVADNTFSPTGSASGNYTFYRKGTSFADVNIQTSQAPGLLAFDAAKQRFSPVSQVVQQNKTGGEILPDGVCNIGYVNKAGKNFLSSHKGLAQAQRVFANYHLIGTVWMPADTFVDAPGHPPTAPNLGASNAVGSVSLANSTAETFVQSTSISLNGQQNCFSCHSTQSFTPGQAPVGAPTLPARRIGISHVVANLSVFAVPNLIPVCSDQDAGPIWAATDAATKCPAACASVHSTWNGQWRTTVPGTQSVCGCCGKT